MTYMNHEIIPDARMSVMHVIAEELVKARNRIEEIGVSLVDDDVYSSNHFSEIQSLDLISQILMVSANVICADGDLDVRVGDIGLQELRDRLLSAMAQRADPVS